MTILTRFFRQSILSYKALFGFYDPKIYFLVKVVNPIMQLIFFVMIAKYIHGSNDITPWVLGNAFILSMYNALFGVGAVMISERSFGTLSLVVVAPANKFLIFTGRAFIHILDACTTVIIGLVTSYLIFDVDFSNTDFKFLALCILITMISAMGIGLFIGSIGLITRDINLILNTSFFVLMIFTGAQFPLGNLPDILQSIPYFLPLTRGIEASRLVVGGDTSINVIYLLGVELLIGLIYTLIGYYALIVFENISRKKASLDIY
ncbi:ABC transporter permease [Sutcliffiella horikoshii]|uniref:ABC transporter permease n=1 Tax=Sutcliffiella horikoshii TaxID=79883 RepID=UPI003CEBD210